MLRTEEQIRELIKKKFRSIPKFAEAAGLPAQTVYSALRNGLASAAASTVLPIATTLELDPMHIVAGRAVPAPKTLVDVPLLGTVAAGMDTDAIPCDETFGIPEEVHVRFPQGFLLRVSGESMNRVLPHGSLALVNPGHEIASGKDLHVVTVGSDSTTIKHVSLLENGIMLVPDSNDPTFHPQVLDFSDPETPVVTIVGKVVWYTLPYLWSFEEHR